MFEEILELFELAKSLSLESGTLLFNAVDDSSGFSYVSRSFFLEEFSLSGLSGNGVRLVKISESLLSFSVEVLDDGSALFFPEFAVLFLDLNVIGVIVLMSANSEYDSLSDEESHNDRSPPATASLETVDPDAVVPANRLEH